MNSLVGYDSGSDAEEADSGRVDATVSTELLETSQLQPASTEPVDNTTACVEPLHADWTECTDAISGETYYWNKHTGETTWDRLSAAKKREQPEGHTAPSLKRERPEEGNSTARAGGLGNRFFSELVRSGVAKAPPLAASLPTGWREAADAQGRTYYYHATSGQTAWERPVAPSASYVAPAGHAHTQPSKKQATGKPAERKYNPMSAIWQKSQFGKPPSQR